ncbi:Holliday junction ATP-dependent DNA helicase RuvA [hydrothermal vent metagenome]|uniref:Holliday junction ATP-dependent DNA helicase RuvA n=1 Tax=hydrothermal vent metagenome TaxID=652676 RepID=A0A3B1CS92_9ZZZZ|nr:Holliday junction branch migration protein RuvA [Candidatus Manganitrophaceae bacterium]
MIASLKGVIALKTPTLLTIDVQGVGYQVFTPLSTYYRLPEEKAQVFLQIYTHIREDAFHLFGFLTLREKEVFLLLLGVTGVGPKLALNILSGIGVSELIEAIREEQVQRLKAIPGVGPKMAGRLILELKEKMCALGDTSTDLPPSAEIEDEEQRDALSALVNLGYSKAEVKRSLDFILRETEDASVEDLIRAGLKHLAKVK